MKRKVLRFDYVFNYFGGDKYNNDVVIGASVGISVRPFVNGKEILPDKELTADKWLLSDLVDVSFDRDNVFKLEFNPFAFAAFKEAYRFKTIQMNACQFTLDVYKGTLSEEKTKNLPAEFKNCPVAEPVEVSEDVFRKFIQDHLNDFDISDNVHAQCPSYEFVEIDDELEV